MPSLEAFDPLLSPRSIIEGAFMGSSGHGRPTLFDACSSRRVLFMGAAFDGELYPEDAGPHTDAQPTSDYIPTDEIPQEERDEDDYAAREQVDPSELADSFRVLMGYHDEDCGTLEDEDGAPLEAETAQGACFELVLVGDQDDDCHGPRLVEPMRADQERAIRARFGDSHGYRGRNQNSTCKKRERLSIRRR